MSSKIIISTLSSVSSVYYTIRKGKTVKGEGTNPHWSLTSDVCNICLEKFGYILKFEDFENEAKQFVRHAGIGNEIFFNKHIHENPHNAKEIDFLAQLDRKTLDALNDIYKLDYLFFDYDPK